MLTPADLAAIATRYQVTGTSKPLWHEVCSVVRALLARVAELEAERDEAVAVLANERGVGEPPGEGWAWDGVSWRKSTVVVKRYEDVDDGWGAWEGRISHTDHGRMYTAREAMRAADRAARVEE